MDDLRLSYEFGKLDDLVEERSRLSNVLKMKPSNQDNVRLKKQLNKTLDILKEAVNDGIDVSIIENYSKKFNNLLLQLPEGTIKVSLYQFEMPVTIVPTSGDSDDIDLPKKVRFKDEESSYAYEPESSHFEPYHDEISETTGDAEMDKHSSEEHPSISGSDAIHNLNIISPGVSNQDVFIQQQQQLLEQDSQLSILSNSVHRSYNMSLDINQEVTEQNDHVLQDLESLVNNSGRNLDKAKRRLEIFEKSAKENGPCAIIVLLVIILILLIVIL
ncbi:hypothetical protein HG535_0E02960 [Zygotorulaspora mrakii]|uniref:t-SNARE coiled-coil homology domain-containing protein n=1 Tax=Zygotorulaspora mrakii TaxID=42260 RepID=A0A7H9B5Z4_ZYGMR|nr:uncharacterized protein HG535_0E02960 [Zygotorulaspora mrakii]QLG73212.1 hypothetical protein HG535_0E02960 [Zygotorulaspora mrakii]